MVKDLDRNIVAIRYNLLNLPDTVQFANGNQIINRYDASGRKLGSRSMTLVTPLVAPVSEGTILGGVDVNAEDDVTASGTDYVGNVEYTVTRIYDFDVRERPVEYYYFSRLHNPEGYVTSSTSGSSPLAPVYSYYSRDHLGNNREVWRAAYYRGTKYNGKEFVETNGYDMYDYEARGMYPAIMRFTTVDPMAEKYPSISPYAYCGNNPVNRIDPNGMEWKTKEDEEYAQSLSQSMTDRMNSEQKSLDKLNAKIAKNQEKEKDVSKDQAKAVGMQENINNLSSGISELAAMGDTKDQVFTYSKIDGNVGGTDTKDGVIVMEIAGNGSKANGIHESSHGYDLWQKGNYTRQNYLSGEVKAYGRQFSFDKNSVPISDFGRANSLNNIDGRWVLGINANGSYIYIEKLFPERNSKDVLKYIK
jgi:RHS repeat-associated protein